MRFTIKGNRKHAEGTHVEFDKETFKKLFPNLAKEMELGENKVAVNSVRTDSNCGERAAARHFVHYDPDVIDFLRRCDTQEQAEEIIAYMEKRGEISKEYAEKLRKQLKEKGVRSFGPKKEENYYLKRGGLLK
ncbi:MAG: DUF2095 family protein [Candidatus Bathyarchaeota archaeon]|nr:DUF2095 family protein [Candidatus Bathyarchaeota archaeon A05DMB-3]MDH7607291.1 DUF2095 family protein [Candidatus Bathyarchaeota archaeon]PMB74166.1 MAG: DUF2095 domain-containing protein [Candidatus Bathyarchaeota archaeon]